MIKGEDSLTDRLSSRHDNGTTLLASNIPEFSSRWLPSLGRDLNNFPCFNCKYNELSNKMACRVVFTVVPTLFYATEIIHCKIIHGWKKNLKMSLVCSLLMLWQISVTKLITRHDPGVVFFKLSLKAKLSSLKKESI